MRILEKKYPVLTYYCEPAGVGVQSTSGLGDASRTFKNSFIPLDVTVVHTFRPTLGQLCKLVIVILLSLQHFLF